MKFSDKLFNFRVANNLSLNAVSKLLGVSSAMLSKYENGQAEPTRKNSVRFNAIIDSYSKK